MIVLQAFGMGVIALLVMLIVTAIVVSVTVLIEDLKDRHRD